MQSEESMRLWNAWQAKGNPPCDHPSTETEFYLGTRTGDVVCTTCGEQWVKGGTPPART